MSNQKYSAKNIVKLDPREHIRRRPGMYVGSIGSRGLHHLIFETLANSVECTFLGACDHIEIILHADNRVTIKDNDTIVPYRIANKHYYVSNQLLSLYPYPLYDIDFLMAEFGFQGRPRLLDNVPYELTGGLIGVGIIAVNTLCAEFEVCIRYKNYVRKRFYRAGLPHAAYQQYQSTHDEPDGLSITFQPDFTIFEKNEFDYDLIAKRCEEIAYTVAGLKITLRDERSKSHREDVFYAPDGLRDWMKKLTQGKKSLHEMIYEKVDLEMTDRRGASYTTKIELALQMTDSDDYVEQAYVNTVETTQGGTHVDGLRWAIETYVNGSYGAPNRLSWEQISKGLHILMSIMHVEPQYKSMSEVRLLNPEVFGLVASGAYECLTQAYEFRNAIQGKTRGN